jgi:predicted nucleic acid-binding protein
MIKYMVDTNICIYIIKQKPKKVIAVLVTNNESGFKRVSKLKIENWAI